MSLLPEGVHGAAQIWQTGSSYWGWENSHPAPCRISTGALQGCVLSPLLFSLYTNDCTSNVPSASFRNVTSLLTDRGLRSRMSGADSLNNLELNTLKTVEMIVDLRRTPPALPHLPSWSPLWLQWSHSNISTAHNIPVQNNRPLVYTFT